MKTGKYGSALRDHEVKLPQEVIEVILQFVRDLSQESTYKRTLWSCCFLSKTWYSLSVPHLYRSPQLSNRNFDKFARTICPPVNSHVRSIGLESFIRHLDMGHLAYESSKSLTARLLRRTRTSLETFVAPAVSFSIACLAPLSKCYNLQSLDLSRDFYDIDLSQLLHAIASLPHLSDLSLPKSAMRKKCPLKAFSEGGPWPVKISHLQLNDYMPGDSEHWRELIASWPPTLRSVTFEECSSWNPFFQLNLSGAKAAHVTSLKIGMRREEDGFPVELLLMSFPNVSFLQMPTPTRNMDLITNVSDIPRPSTALTELSFRIAPEAVHPKPKITTRLLLQCIQLFPQLTRVEAPELHLQLDEQSLDDLERIEMLIDLRPKPPGSDVGLILTT